MNTHLNFTYNADAIYRPAIDGIKKAFAEYKHDPSPDHWDGISDIVKAIEGMATGLHTWSMVKEQPIPAFKDTFYISSLPCGMGKTTALIETVRAIMNLSDPMYQDISFIIFLSRLTEISALVERIGLDEKDYSVIVSPDEEVYKKGNQNKKAARVLFTTQQMLERRCHDGNQLRKFSEIGDFFYNGKPRQVRVWDEAILPSKILTIELDELMALPIELFKINADFADTVRKFSFEVGAAKDGDLVDVPGLAPYEELLDGFETLQGLHAIAGKAVKVSIDNRKKTTTLQYADILPGDIKPLLILDASGEQRATYDLWKQWRKDLTFLHSPGKSYEGLTVRHWDRGSGKGVISKKKKDYLEIVEGVSNTIADLPDKKILVIHHKPDKSTVDLEEEIKRYLGASYDPDRIKFLTWGRHTATNDFKDFEHVILTSLWYYSPAAYEANVYGAKNQDVAIPATKEEKKYSEEGEHRHHILQAACRGKVRYAIDGKCPNGCHLWMIYSTMQGLASEKFISSIFPDCSYEPWRPLGLTGKAREIAEYMLSHKGEISVRGLLQSCRLRRYRLVEHLDKELIPWFSISQGMNLTYDEEKDILLLKERIARPF